LTFLTVHSDCFWEDLYLLSLFYNVQLSKERQSIQAAFLCFKGKGVERKDRAQRQDGITFEQNPRSAFFGLLNGLDHSDIYRGNRRFTIFTISAVRVQDKVGYILKTEWKKPERLCLKQHLVRSIWLSQTVG